MGTVSLTLFKPLCCSGGGISPGLYLCRFSTPVFLWYKKNDHTNNNWSHWDSNEKLKEKYGSCTRKTL